MNRLREKSRLLPAALLGIPLLCALVYGSVSGQTFTDLKGNWKTVWNIDGTNIFRFYFKITKSGTVFSGALDDLDEGGNNLSAAGVSISYPSVLFDFSNYGFVFQGTMNSNYTQITGTWTGDGESWPLVWEREPSVDEMQARTYSDAYGTLPYRLFVPSNYTASVHYPLVLFLHGSGERGTDNRTQVTGQSGVLAFLWNENQAKQQCFLAAPQCPTSGNWYDTARHAQLPALIASLKTQFNIDADRVYVTGLSMGGGGTWDMLALDGSLFAAGIPLSGFAGSLTAAATSAATYGIPIWNFHAADDGTVNVSNSRNLISGNRNLGGTPIYTEFATGGHAIWSAAYATPLLYDWLIAQKRGTAATVAPFVSILYPTAQPYMSTTNSSVPLEGIAGNAIAAVSQIAWTNNRGGSGVALGMDKWSVRSAALLPGTNMLTAMATGTAWVTGYGGNTTFSDVLKVGMPYIAAPTITAQPFNATVAAGASAAFTVGASGPLPLSYQWRFNGTNIAGATQSLYVTNNVQVVNAGGYSVVVSNPGGPVSSTTAFLSVLAPLSNPAGAVVAPAGMVNWWPAEGNPYDIFAGANGTPQNGFSYAPGKVGLGFHFDGSTSSLNTGAPSLSPPWTACFWVNRQDAPGTGAALTGDGTYELKLEQYNLTRKVGITQFGVGDYTFNYIAPTGTWVHLVFVGTGTGTALYANGVLQGTLANNIPLPRAYLGAGYVSSSARFVDFMLGTMDEVMVFNRALSAAEINAIYSAGSAGLCRAPEFTGCLQPGTGQVGLNLRGQTGKNFSIYASTDLLNWAPLATVPNPSGAAQFVDYAVTNMAKRFYRASQP